jgi:putative ABC transport system permease protein
MSVIDPGTLGLGDKTTTLQSRSVAPGFFEALGIRLIAGRTFAATDTQGTTRVVVINESLAKRYFAGKDALGQILKMGRERNDEKQIVGVVTDTRDVHVSAAARPQVYLPLLQRPDSTIHLFIRGGSDPVALAPELRSAIWAIDKEQPISGVQTMTEVIAESVAEPRFRTLLLGVFAAVGLTLTLVGVYGVISYGVSQRTREIGIRVALGAQPGSVLRLVLGGGIRLAVIGAAAGIAGSLALARVFKSLLFDIKPTDPVTLVSAALLMLVVALAASYVPARRATRVNPIDALRQD